MDEHKRIATSGRMPLFAKEELQAFMFDATTVATSE